MKTIRVKLTNCDKSIVRAFIDSGSQHSYVTKNMASNMDYEPITDLSLSHSLFGGKIAEVIKHSKYLIYVSSLEDSLSLCGYRSRRYL